jgi:hypothetical protein
VHEMPVSGSPDELLHAAGIDADGIATAARRRLDEHRGHRDQGNLTDG